MQPREIQYIRESFDSVGTRLDPLVDSLYAKLFELNPDIAAIFPSDLAEQRAHFSGALTFLVRNIDKLETIDVALRAMGARHFRYGVEPSHFIAFKVALLFAMNAILGDDWDDPSAQAWAAALDEIAELMLGSTPLDRGEVA